jgi:hypothetical protein
VGPLLLLGLAITLYGWVTGVGASGFPLRGTGPPAPPLSELAATNALGHAFLYVFLLGLPVFAVGSIVGVALAIARYVARKEQGRAGWPASTREAEDVRAMTEKLFGDTEEGGAVLGRLFGGVPGTAGRTPSLKLAWALAGAVAGALAGWLLPAVLLPNPHEFELLAVLGWRGALVPVGAVLGLIAGAWFGRRGKGGSGA